MIAILNDNLQRQRWTSTTVLNFNTSDDRQPQRCSSARAINFNFKYFTKPATYFTTTATQTSTPAIDFNTSDEIYTNDQLQHQRWTSTPAMNFKMTWFSCKDSQLEQKILLRSPQNALSSSMVFCWSHSSPSCHCFWRAQITKNSITLPNQNPWISNWHFGKNKK